MLLKLPEYIPETLVKETIYIYHVGTTEEYVRVKFKRYFDEKNVIFIYKNIFIQIITIYLK